MKLVKRIEELREIIIHYNYVCRRRVLTEVEQSKFDEAMGESKGILLALEYVREINDIGVESDNHCIELCNNIEELLKQSERFRLNVM